MSRDYCPQCSSIQNLTYNILELNDISENNEAEEIDLVNYYCEKCGEFIKSEQLRIRKKKEGESEHLIFKK